MAMVEFLGAPGLLHRSIYFLQQELPEEDRWIPMSQDPRQPTRRELPPSTYQILTASANVCEFTITVTEGGTFQYEQEFEGLLAGNGTSRLTFNGFPVTIDARYVCGVEIPGGAGTGESAYCGGSRGVWFFLGESPFPVIRHRECRMVPTRYGYQVELGSAAPSPFNVFLDQRGRWSYRRSGSTEDEAGFEVANGGFLAGGGTSRLEILGYPCIVDARASGARRLQVNPVGALLGSDTLVQRFNLLPVRPASPERPAIDYRILLDGAEGPGFHLDLDGTFTAVGSGIEIDTFQRIPRIRVTG